MPGVELRIPELPYPWGCPPSPIGPSALPPSLTWHLWLLARLQGWTGWVCYNDETPEGSTASGTKFGHCKGILAWRQDRIAWLVHSVPAWPEAMSNESLPPLVASGLRCGQSFLFLSLPRTGDLLRRICGERGTAARLGVGARPFEAPVAALRCR